MTKEFFNRTAYKPVKLSAKRDITGALKAISKKNQAVQIVDQYESMLEELFLLRNPGYRFDKDYRKEYEKFREIHLNNKHPDSGGAWFYYPWLNCAVHFLSEPLHQELRTGRNRNLITEKEQREFYRARVAILGMSVGSHVALTIVMTGGAKHIKLADPDILSGSNLNRVRTGFQNIGLSKVISVARQIYEINPYAKVEIFPQGAGENNLKKILTGGGKLGLLVEEMDNPYLKLRARELARAYRIPVIMAADNDNGIIVDVERYDLNKKHPILLHGIMGITGSGEIKTVDPQNLHKVIAKMAGAELSTVRMLESVTEVGKTLYSWPQLGNAATLCGSVLAFLARKIILKEPIKSGRTNFSPDAIFTPLTKAARKQRQAILNKMGI